MHLSDATKIAVDLCYKLQPYCDRINIAGSIRRKKSDVKDIEICCLPKYIEMSTPTLFGDGESVKVISPVFCETVQGLGKVSKGKLPGRYMAIELPEGINLDLFMPAPWDYIRQYVVRTGCADYAARVIAGGWKKIGWCGSDQGLRKITDCFEMKTTDGKSKWKCINKNAELPPHWQTEEEFYRWLKVPFTPPQLRNV